MIKEITNLLLQSKIPSETQIKEVFDEINSGLADFIEVSSFIAALGYENLSSDILLGAIVSSRDFIKKYSCSCPIESFFEIVNFNDSSEYLDIKLGVNLVCSCAGLNTVSYSFDSPFYKDLSLNILKEWQINFNYNNDYWENLERTGFINILTDNNSKYFKYTHDISRKLNFRNIFNITDKMLNPMRVKNQIIYLDDEKKLNDFAMLSFKLNNLNTIILHSEDNFPYASCESEIKLCEAWKNKVFTYKFTCDLLNLERFSVSDLKCQNTQENAKMLYRVFEDKNISPQYNAIILNSALALYITKKADSLIGAVDLAKEIINKDLVLKKIDFLRKFYS